MNENSEDNFSVELGQLERASDFLTALGLLTTQYSILELCVVRIIGLALNGNFEAAVVIANNNSSAATRLEIAKDLIGCSSLLEHEKTRILILLDRASAINSRRNKYIHGLWGLRQATTDVILTSRLYARVETRVVAAAELHEENREIRALYSEILEKVLKGQLISPEQTAE